MLNKKKILITGGTGSFGKALLNKHINNKEFKEIRVFLFNYSLSNRYYDENLFFNYNTFNI